MGPQQRDMWSIDLAAMGLGHPPQAPQLCALLRAPAPKVKAFVVSEAQGLPGCIVFLRRPHPLLSLNQAEEPLPPPRQALCLRLKCVCLLGLPQWAPARPLFGPSQLPLSPPCLSGLLSLHSVCH